MIIKIIEFVFKTIDLTIILLTKIFKILFILLFFIIIFIFSYLTYTWLFPSLGDRFFVAIEKKCSQQFPCKIHLHEITLFKWDKAYFFPSNRNYSNQDIKKITGISFDLQKYKAVKDQEYKTLAMFIYHDKLVKYNFFDVSFETDNPFDHPSKKQYFDILFSVDLTSDMFRNKYYFGEKIMFNKSFQIDYYEITPMNDLLYIIFTSQGDYYNGYVTQALALCSKLDQVHLH